MISYLAELVAHEKRHRSYLLSTHADRAEREFRSLAAVARAAKPIARAWSLLTNPTADQMERFRRAVERHEERRCRGFRPKRPGAAPSSPVAPKENA